MKADTDCLLTITIYKGLKLTKTLFDKSIDVFISYIILEVKGDVAQDEAKIPFFEIHIKLHFLKSFYPDRSDQNSSNTVLITLK